jgi:hypothetical protein
MPKPTLFETLESPLPVLLPISRLASHLPLLGRGLPRWVPVSNDEGTQPLTATQPLEWSPLEAFAWLAPQCDNPQRETTARQWMPQAGLGQIAALRVGHAVAQGLKQS